MEPTKGSSFWVGRCLVRPRLGTISTDGNTVHVEPKVMEVLVCLAGKASEVVSKDELLQTVWASTFVTEHVLKVAVSELRKALGDDARDPRFIQTIPKQGYRLIADVSVENHEAPTVAPTGASAAARRGKLRWLIPSVALASLALIVVWKFVGWPGPRPAAANLRTIQSIVVLPLEDSSVEGEEEYFADGMTEALIADLARTGSLKVISRTSAMAFKGTAKTIPEIAKGLGVDAVVEGSVTRDGNQVRIIVRLIDGADDRSLWTQTYEREMRDILALQDDVASDIARQISHQVDRETKPAPINAEAYEAYLKSRFFWNKLDKESLLKSVTYAQRAIELEPGFAQAYTGLADAYNFLGVFGYAPQDDVYPKAKAAALKALEIGPRLSEAHAALAFNLMYRDWSWRSAEEEYQQAISLDPGRAINHHWAASLYSILSRHDAALSEAREAQRLDLLSLNVNGDLGWYYYYAGRFDEAIRQCRRTLELEPSGPSMRLCLELCYLLKGQSEDAFAVSEEALKLAQSPLSVVEAHRRAFAKSGWQGSWRFRIQSLERYARQKKGRAYQLAVGHALLGETDRAFFWLDRALADREGWVGFIPVDPAFAALHSDARFQSIVDLLGVEK